MKISSYQKLISEIYDTVTEKLSFYKITEELRLGNKKIPKKEFSFLRDSAKPIKKGINSLFAEVYKVGNYAMKIREFKNLEELKEYNRYQLKLQKTFDFLPNYYGSLIGEYNRKIIFASFFEWIPPLESFNYFDIVKIFKIIKQLYQKGYYGLDFKWSNFGKKEGKIYYLDDLGIGRIIPKDVEKSLKSLFLEIIAVISNEFYR